MQKFRNNAQSHDQCSHSMNDIVHTHGVLFRDADGCLNTMQSNTCYTTHSFVPRHSHATCMPLPLPSQKEGQEEEEYEKMEREYEKEEKYETMEGEYETIENMRVQGDQ